MPVFNVIGGLQDGSENGANVPDIDFRAVTFIFGWALSLDPVGNLPLYQRNQGHGAAMVCQKTGVLSNHLHKNGWPDNRLVIRGVGVGPAKPPTG